MYEERGLALGPVRVLLISPASSAPLLSAGKTGSPASRSRATQVAQPEGHSLAKRWDVERRCDAGLALGGGEVATGEQSSKELVGFASSELTRGARWAWRRARNSSCDAVGGVVGELEESLVWPKVWPKVAKK